MDDSKKKVSCSNPDCSTKYLFHIERCPDCGILNREAEFPNWFHAETERDALQHRYDEAWSNGRQRGLDRVLSEFEAYCRQTCAVINRYMSDVLWLVIREDRRYANWYQLTERKMQIPEGSQWDQLRQSVDPAIFPFYYNKMYFACLSPNQQGLWNYGNCTMVLAEKFIQRRASVFEENTITWYKRVGFPNDMPAGYRATWVDRHLLCVAKCEPKLRQGDGSTAFCSILLKQGKDTGHDEFVEVHIYESFTRKALERVVIRQADFLSDDQKTPLLERQLLEEKLAAVGIPLEVC